MKIYIVIWKDRHADTEVYPFSNPEEAIAFAKEKVEENCDYPEDLDEELSAPMIADGWIYYGCYSCEGDSIRVVTRELDGEVDD